MPVIDMHFSRGDVTARACVEYSYVPQPLRRTFFLSPKVFSESRRDSLPVGFHPTHVLVHTLNNANRMSAAVWQFPFPLPYPEPITEVLIHIDTVRLVAIGTVRYRDGHTLSDERDLDPHARECPERR